MKQLFIYGNIAKNARVEYDPKTGECKCFKAKETTTDADAMVVDTIRKIVAKYPEESFTFIVNRNIAVPVLQAMNVLNYLVLGKPFGEDDEEKIENYVKNVQAAGIDVATVDRQDAEALKALIKAALNNVSLQDADFDFMLDLMIIGDYKFRNIDMLLQEPREGAVLGQVSKYVREIALELVNETCKIPEVTKVELEDDLDEEIA